MVVNKYKDKNNNNKNANNANNVRIISQNFVVIIAVYEISWWRQAKHKKKKTNNKNSLVCPRHQTKDVVVQRKRLNTAHSSYMNS